MKTTFCALLVGAGALVSSAAIAGDKKDGDYDWEAKVEEHFNKVDANGDGQVTREEFLAYKAAKAEKEWDKHAEAAGDDGQVSLDEAKAMHKAKKEKHHKKHKEMKKDG